MLLPAGYILQSLSWETSRSQGGGDASIESSGAASIALALNLLGQRERGGAGRVRTQAEKLDAALSTVIAMLPESTIAVELDLVRADLQRLQQQQDLQVIELVWRQTLCSMEALVQAVNADADIESSVRGRIAQILTTWESEDLRSQFASAQDGQDAPDDELSAMRWSQYLQRRFDDPNLQLMDFRPLPGGFGKQTFLFDVQGRSLSGSFVIRRDMPDPLLINDCHSIDKEYHLIRAMHARDFPAPEALWLDTEHADVPGGDFIVMRRSPGISGGSFFGAQQEIPSDLAQTLAVILARLHALEPMPELDGLTDSINLKLWNAPLDECVRWYIESWLAMFQQESHLPSPAIISLFGWLLDHIPSSSGKPVLLHGDIGFHNFLFDDRRLSAVLDWEFSHLGDPAEDLAYVRNTVGSALDWDAFIGAYRQAGGVEVDARRLHFFQVWGLLRNACAANMAAAKFVEGRVTDLKMVVLPHMHIPQFLSAAQALVDSYV